MKISKTQNYQVKKIGEKHDLKMILLHGSYVKGSNHVGSDLDIAVLGRREIKFNRLLKINSELARVLGDTKARELDMKSLHKANPLFLYQVLSNSKLIFGNVNDYDELRAYSFKLFFDAKGLFELEDKLISRYQKSLNKKYA